MACSLEGGCNSSESIHIDINTTSICNIACTYCSEGNECGLSTLYMGNTEVKVEDLIKKLGKDPAKHKTINFWGGEPFVNFDFCKAIIDGFKDDKTFSFFFYTNGLYIPNYIDQLKEWNEEFGKEINPDGQTRLYLQISYDGRHLTNTVRVDKGGNGTADRVEQAYKLLKENNIGTSLKAVISTEGFPYLFESFKDLYELQGFYSPTPDLWSDRSEEEFNGDLEILGKELEKITKYIYQNDLNPEVFSWFAKSRAICSTGAGMLSIDLDGGIYPCHAGMYGESEEHKIGELEDWETIRENVMKDFKKINTNLPLECQTCDVNYCMKCQIANYAKSTKDTYEERFTDYQANWQVCKIFKMNDKYNKTLRYAMTKKGLE